MKKKYKIILLITFIIIISISLSVNVFSITESEVQAQVTARGREAVSGNIFIWFLCAVAFLKISQKIDSFMSSLGINVGHTGGSLLAETMIAAKGISAGKKYFGGGGLSGSNSSGTPGSTGGKGTSGSSSGFMSGGLAGVVSRSFNRGAVKNATGESGGGIGGKVFASSMEKGGDFANNIIGSVAQGSITSTGMITGENAVKAINSYLGYTSQSSQTDILSAAPAETPIFSNVEIGGGRIMGTETSGENPTGIEFGMYNTQQYIAPEGQYSTVETADGSKWYKQYAQDTVDKTPYMAPDGSIAYNEAIIKRLPDIPRRKDRV